MTSAKEIKKHLNVALEEIGEIKPHFNKRFNAWVYHHKKYPDVEYVGNSPEEVIQNYPKYLREFIKHRLDNNIWESVEKMTPGCSGKTARTGRPKGAKKEAKKRVYLPTDIADWAQDHPAAIRQLIAKSRD